MIPGPEYAPPFPRDCAKCGSEVTVNIDNTAHCERCEATYCEDCWEDVDEETALCVQCREDDDADD